MANFLNKKLKLRTSFFRNQPTKRWQVMLFAACFAFIGVIIALISFADNISTPTSPNAIVLQYSLPHVLMPTNPKILTKPMYQPFTLYGNGLLVCGHHSDMDFMPQHAMDMKNPNTDTNLPTATTLNPDELHALVQRVVDTGFLNLQPEYFKIPLGSRQYTIRLALTSGDHFVMYYGDVQMPTAYSDTLQILGSACSGVTQSYQSDTVRLHTLKDADAQGNAVAPIDSTSATAAPAIKRGLAGADQTKEKAINPKNIPSPIFTNNLAQSDQELKGQEAKAVIQQLKGKEKVFYKSNGSVYEVGADPILPPPSNPLTINYRELRAKRNKSPVSTLLNKVAFSHKAHADTILPVRVVVLLASDGGDAGVLGAAQDYGQKAHDWYCGQVGKCYTYQGASVIRGSQTMTSYMTCHYSSGCPGGPLDAIINNIFDYEPTIYRRDVDTLVVTSWSTNTLAAGACGLGLLGFNLGAIDPFTSQTTSAQTVCPMNVVAAHEIGHTFGLSHTGNLTLMDGPPLALYGAPCGIDEAPYPNCTLDAGQKTTLQSSALSYIFNAPYTASTGPSTSFYRYFNPAVTDHYYDINRNDNSLASGGWTAYEGCEANVYTTQQVGTTRLWRYWNPTNTDHFYTTTRNDAGYEAYGYVLENYFEGYAYPSYTQPKGTIPLWRYWNKTGGDHLYTTTRNDAGYAPYGYYLESIEAYVLPPPANHCQYATAPLWRYWNSVGQDHFYTTNRNDAGYGYYGYHLEKCEARVYTQAGPGMVPLWRYFNGKATDHFYTTNRNDAGYGYYGYGFENQEGWVYSSTSPTMGRALYRYWSPSRTDHFYTVDRNDAAYAAGGWQFERIEAYVSSC